jgi:hypothetical protein
MVTFQDVQTAYYMVAATGVLVAAIYYIYNMRNTEKTRKREIAFNRFQINRLDYYQAFNEVGKMIDWKTPEEFYEKYGRLNNSEAYSKWMYVMSIYNQAGLLLRSGFASAEDLVELYGPMGIVRIWELFVPVVEWMRTMNKSPEYMLAFEELYKVAKRLSPNVTSLREQTL